MKRILHLSVMSFLVAITVVNCAWAQESLGDLARQQRQGKRPSAAKVYTNDDFAMAPTPGAPYPALTDAKPEKTDAEPAATPEKSDKAAPAEKTDKTKLAAGFKSKADEQKKNITQLERELDVAQREYRLKVAVYYADAGNNLRDGKKWAEEDKKQRAELDSKQKALADAKQKLADIQEEARRSGVSAE